VSRSFDVPFFSICVEVHNRETTISKVLRCIENQTCRDFELIIIDNGSTDDSAELVAAALSNFKDIPVIFRKDTRTENEIVGWNRPLKVAQGRFIAICEGDDYFLPTHLAEAKKTLQTTQDVGIYVAGSKLSSFQPSPIVSSHEKKLDELKRLSWCPAPSTVIFRRTSREGLGYLFDESFVWAGEYSLYYEILVDGYKVIENFSNNFVERGFRYYVKTSFHMLDMIQMRESSRFHYTSQESKSVDSVIARRAMSLLIFQIVFFKFEIKLFNIFLRYFVRSEKNLSKYLMEAIKSLSSAIKLRIYLTKN